jgi:hypothetical protein
MLDRPLQGGGEERVVHHGQRAREVRKSTRRLDVGDPEQRVAGRLDPDQPGGPLQCPRQLARGGEVDELDLELSLACETEATKLFAVVSFGRS